MGRIFDFMENQKQLGGKRRGAGRKPILHKKKQVSLYVEGSKIVKFGSEDKMKEHLYEVIDKFGVATNYENPVSELKNLPAYSVHDIRPNLEVKAPIIKKSVNEWIAEKREMELPEQYEAFIDRLNADTYLTPKEKTAIKYA